MVVFPVGAVVFFYRTDGAVSVPLGHPKVFLASSSVIPPHQNLVMNASPSDSTLLSGWTSLMDWNSPYYYSLQITISLGLPAFHNQLATDDDAIISIDLF